MRKIAAFLLITLLAGAACRKGSAPPVSQAPTPTPTPAEEMNHFVGGATAPPQTKYFKGSIGTSLDLQMNLVREGDQLNGSYFYEKVGTRINLRGTVDKDGNLTLQEFDPSGKQTGVFKGLWQVGAADGLITLAGNWSKPPGEKGEEKKTAFSVHEEPINLSGDVELVGKASKESNKKLMYEIDARYPQLNGGANPNFPKFNQASRLVVTKEIAKFRKAIAPEADEEPPPQGSMGSELSISYSIALAQDDVLSVKFDVSTREQGAAHPNSYSSVLNYDLRNGRQLKLADLFKPGAKFLPALSTYCVADLKKQAKDKGLLDEQIQEGAAPSAGNYESWTITRRGLGIVFDPSQVGPYAAGPQFVLVPYSALKDLIKPDGPLAQFAQ